MLSPRTGVVSDRALRRTPAAQVEPDDAARYTGLVTNADTGGSTRPICQGYRPHAKQRVAHYLAELGDTDVVCVNAGRRSGKSEWVAAQHSTAYLRDMWAKRCGTGRWAWRGPSGPWRPTGKAPEPFLHYAIVAPTYSLLDPLKRKFQRMLRPYEAGGWIVHQTGQTWWLLGGIRIDWRSGDRPDRLVAENYDGVALDEFARLKGSIWEDNLQPALADSGGWATLTSTPLGKASAWYRAWSLGDPVAAAEIAEQTGEDLMVDPHVRCVSWTSMDNTAAPRVAEYAMRMKKRMPGPMWRRNFQASWVAFFGQVLGELQEARHLKVVDPSTLVRIMAGMDFGWRNPAVLSVWGESYDGRVHELESVVAKQRPVDGDFSWQRRERGDRSTWTATAWALLDKWSRWCPYAGHRWEAVPLYLPADNPEAKAQFEGRGFNVEAAYQDRQDGLDWFVTAVHNDEVTIATPAVYRSLESLVHPDSPYGKDAELWDKARSDDHAFDAGRYTLTEYIRSANRGLGRELGYSVLSR